MAAPLDIAMQVSDLFEATGYEGSEIAEWFDSQIMPELRDPLEESNIIGIGKRFQQALERVRQTATAQGPDKIRTLMDMMKSALLTYVRRTNDIMTGRTIFHKALRGGADNMLTVTAAAILANVLNAAHPEQAKGLMSQIASRLSGPQGVRENASGAATSAGAVAAVSTPLGKKKLQRRDSIFAETGFGLTLDDLEGKSTTLAQVIEINQQGRSGRIDNVIVDPTTAELVLVVAESLTPEKRARFEAKPIDEMIEIANRVIERGIIQVVAESA